MIRRIEIPFGKTKQSLTLDEQRIQAVLVPRHPSLPDLSEQEIVLSALRDPIGSESLSRLAEGKERIVIISSDHTRPVPSRITMPLLLSELRRGNPGARITILIATGMHRPTTEAELRDRFGDEIVSHEEILVHNAFKPEDMDFYGTLPSGGALRLNKCLKEADLLLAEGFIEPHFFAGFSGGRKCILPGVADAGTVMYNHNARFIADPHARQGILEDNPIHQDMVFAARVSGLRFILNVLLDSEKRITAAVAGDPEKAHEAGCRRCLDQTRLIPVPADIVITSNGGYPLDQNIYQAVKGMTAAEACVREGGVIIMLAALGDGHGGDNFYRWFARGDSPQEILQRIEAVPPEETTPDQWQAQILARILKKARCIFVTGEENRALIEGMHMDWAPDVNAALAMADSLTFAAAPVTVIPDGVGVILVP